MEQNQDRRRYIVLAACSRSQAWQLPGSRLQLPGESERWATKSREYTSSKFFFTHLSGEGIVVQVCRPSFVLMLLAILKPMSVLPWSNQ
jgi:hypothetical protein